MLTKDVIHRCYHDGYPIGAPSIPTDPLRNVTRSVVAIPEVTSLLGRHYQYLSPASRQGFGLDLLRGVPYVNTDPRCGMATAPFVSTGVSREGDELILEAALYLNKIRPAAQAIRVLGLAEGRTYAKPAHEGTNYDFGSPWLARSMKKIFGDRLEIEVTDRAKARPFFWIFDLEGTLLRAAILEGPPEQIRRVLHSFRSSELSAAPEGGHTLVPCAHLTRAQLEDFLPLLCEVGTSGLTPHPALIEKKVGYRVVLRPNIDPDVEECFFGITMREKVDLSNVADRYERASFDLIYVRHFDNQDSAVLNGAMNGVRTLLKPGGIAVLTSAPAFQSRMGEYTATHRILFG